jgi:acyl-[acyl-carrier-protein]-phospholipid O-acyltransferase / long-chain-fatty-acid--[acyl-carrier-protein] ligase
MKIVKVILGWLARRLFKFRAYHVEVLSEPGPVLLVPNHVSWLDWVFIGLCLDDDWRFVTSSQTAQSSWLHRRIMMNRRTFPIDMTSPYAVKRMAEHLQAGGRLVLFAEGRITTTGSLMKLYEGTGFLLHKTHARVITAYLRGGNRLRWVKHTGWRLWFPEVTLHFSAAQTPPVQSGISTNVARARLSRWLRDQMERQQFETEMQFGPTTVLAAIQQMARLRPHQLILEDVSGQPLSYARLMIGVRVLAQLWARILSAAGDRVGVLLPNVNAMPVVLLSLWAVRKIPAILNFSTGITTMKTCAELAGLKAIITSRQFLLRAKLELSSLENAGIAVVYLEDVQVQVNWGLKALCLIRDYARMPLGFPGVHEDPAVVLFTSGSEGTPKGVLLTHGNLLANVRQMLAVTDILDQDRLFNALPLFHSFGLTVGTLLPLVRGLSVVLYPSPLHYRIVPAACYERNCTILLGTNTFLNGYARKANPYDFRGVRYLFAGAEKIQEATANIWSRQFGVRILEGYGATECSPAISVNTPQAARFGATGRLMPSMEYRLEPVDGVTEGGRLLVRGPNVMKGYLNADANARFQALGGWYDTGDIARVDADGFVFLLGRLKRFAKISGEMVSLTSVEDALAGAFPQYGLRCQVAILSRPDEDKGEVLVAVANEPKLGLDEIRAALKAKGLTNLCVPRDIFHVRELPKLGTGKINHRELAGLITNRP